ncbi:MAG: class I SAM-dependent methyltransferase [Fimbriimonadaceae bacterium]|nr:class I SAM-dependent methyltransferase [Fimbriimonadaceae bacterium]
MIAVCAGKQERLADLALAAQLAAAMAGRLVRRQGRSVAELLATEELPGVVLVTGGEPVWQPASGPTFAWHPNMAVPRLRAAAGGGQRDTLRQALGLQPGDCVVDATLGLAADALVVSQLVGPRGRVVGIEASPVIAALVRHGLATRQHALAPAMRAIEVLAGDHLDWLHDPLLTTAGCDAVLFDPMFDRPLPDAVGLAGLRTLACEQPLRPAALEAARRLARRAVVVKGRLGDPLFEALPASRRLAGSRARFGFAVFEPLA